MRYAVKAEFADLEQRTYAFRAHKTMYGGKRVTAGDTMFLFAREGCIGRGLFARGIVTYAAPVAKNPSMARQALRVDVMVAVSARARTQLGRAELRAFREWGDGRPETELNFKLYRQATDKVVGITDATGAFLDGCL